MNFQFPRTKITLIFYRKGLADRYISRVNTRKLDVQDDNTYRDVYSNFFLF